MTAGEQILIYSANGNGTGSSFIYQRRRRDTGQVQVEYTPFSGPSTVTVKIQGSADVGRDAPWTTVKSFTEAELGASGGSVEEDLDFSPGLRVVVSNVGDSRDNVKVWSLE